MSVKRTKKLSSNVLTGKLSDVERQIHALRKRYGDDAQLKITIKPSGWGQPEIIIRVDWELPLENDGA